MTQIDIAALVADLTGPIPVIEGLSGPYPDETAIRDTADQAAAALIAQDAELKRYREALTEAKETLVEVKRDMWREAAPRWIMADFLNWAIVQRITASIVSTRAALGEKP